MRILSDSELFVEQTTWFAPHLPQRTIGAFACWIAPWLRKCSKRALESLYRLNHPAQQAAEGALVALLEAAPKRASQMNSVRAQCGRGTDWASTLAIAHPYPPTQFVERKPSMELDVGVLAGLASVARDWAFLLTEYGGYGELHPRVAQLRSAARPFGSGRLTLPHLRRLARSPCPEGHVDALRTALELMSAPLDTPQARVSLSRLNGELLRVERAALKNQDDALEVSVTLCIARAAVGLGWTIRDAYASATNRKPRIVLGKDKMRCAIAKGVFEYPGDSGRRVVDVLAKMERESLGLASTGRQPDVVISFWHVDRPSDVLFCIADAKRNESDDGVAYLKKSITAMATYMVAFAEPLQARLFASTGGFDAPLLPAATLFLRQGSYPIAGAGTSHDRHAHGSLGWLATLDGRHYAECDQGVWLHTPLKRWFASLSRKAEERWSRALPSP
jgi:hypothetical protein